MKHNFSSARILPADFLDFHDQLLVSYSLVGK